jgi:hypothetical protein
MHLKTMDEYWTHFCKPKIFKCAFAREATMHENDIELQVRRHLVL